MNENRLPTPGDVWRENDPRQERYVLVVSYSGAWVRIRRVNKDGSAFPRSRMTETQTRRFGGTARGKYSFVRSAQ